MTEPIRTNSPTPKGWLWQSYHPFQKASVRGLAIVTPPLLTIILFFWAWHTVNVYILQPLESLAATIIVWSIDESLPDAQIQIMAEIGEGKISPAENFNPASCELISGRTYIAIKRTWIPAEVYDLVENRPGHNAPLNSVDYYRQYAKIRYLDRRYILPAFLALFIALLYMFGKLFALGIGRLFWNGFENMINRVPIIRHVYSSVKQVTDFAFNEQDIKFTRIVAIEYPRPGVWSMGFVTGDGISTLQTLCGEPVVNVLMPTSPMPAAGFTIAVPKSKTIDLDITMDQAIQFLVSCGVVSPSGLPRKGTAGNTLEKAVKPLTQTAVDE